MKLIKDFKINNCTCYRDYCDEWSTHLDAEFYLAEPETFTLFDRTFVVDRILFEESFCGMNSSYTEIPDLAVVKIGTNSGERFEYIEVPNEFLFEIAEIFKQLEKQKDKRLNDCIISESILDFLEARNEINND